MARLRNNRSRGRLLSRGLVVLLLVGCAVFALYAFNPFGGSDEVALADVGEPVSTEAKTSADEDKPGVLRTTTPSPRAKGESEAPRFTVAAAPERTSTATADAEPEAQVASSSDGFDDFAPEEAAPAVPPSAPRGDWQTEAERLSNNGQLLEARAVLNDALQTGGLSPEDAKVAKEQLRNLNQVIVFTPTKRFSEDPFQGEHTVASGDLLSKIAGPLDVPYGFLARINGVQPNKIRLGQSLKTIKGPIHAEVSKGRFEIDLYLGGLPGTPGSMYLWTYPVGLGADSSTPKGLWEVTRGSKLVNPEWTNPRTNEVYGRDNPENPLGERWIGLTGIGGDALGQPSYGIHGTIQPETIGTNASMGCVRLVHDDILEVYDMLSEGSSLVRVTD